MTTSELLRANLLSPITLSFALGMAARVVRSEFSLPKDIYLGLSIFLLWSLGLQGGIELRHARLDAIAWPAVATVLLGCLTPVTTYLAARRLGRFSAADSAALAAHYGSVSAVTFIAAGAFVKSQGAEAEGFLPTLLTLLESPGIAVALTIGALHTRAAERPVREVLHEVLTGRTMVLLLGGLAVGYLIGDAHWEVIGPLHDTTGPVFRGLLCLFMLEMGVTAGARLGDLRRVGGFLLGLGVLLPLVHGALGAWAGHAAGLSVGGATVLGSMAASASYIAAPPAVRLTLPDANPTYYLTAALVITFPFNLLVGIPVYFRIASWLGGPP